MGNCIMNPSGSCGPFSTGSHAYSHLVEQSNIHSIGWHDTGDATRSNTVCHVLHYWIAPFGCDGLMVVRGKGKPKGHTLSRLITSFPTTSVMTLSRLVSSSYSNEQRVLKATVQNRSRRPARQLPTYEWSVG